MAAARGRVRRGLGALEPLTALTAMAAWLLSAAAHSAPAPEALPVNPLLVPVAGVSAASLRDTFADRRGEHPHEALDIAAPTGSRVLAADDGIVAKLFTSVPGGITLYQFDPSRRFAYYYAHLAAYAGGVHEGMVVHRGDLIGYVGTSGNARVGAPHLHFALFRLGPQREWWKGTPIDPYRLFDRSSR